jgi:isocitrate/isopropylmalate dehydrogenase
LILFRRGFDPYVNLRPVRLLPGVPFPLANRKPGDIVLKKTYKKTLKKSLVKNYIMD